MKFALIIIELLLLAANCFSAEPGKPFVPPKDEPKLVLVADPAPVGASAACPMDASVLISVSDGPSSYTGSGTVVDSSNGESLILTCAHTWRGVKNPDVRVIAGKKDLVATIVKQDDYTDLAVLRVKAELPAIDLADSTPVIGETVVSVGASINGQSLQEKSHTLTTIETTGKPPFVLTDGNMQWSGRSGGGLFHNGQLIGTVIGFRNDSRLSMYTTLEQCRAILSGPVGGSTKYAVTLWKAPFRCVPCDRSENNLISDARFDLTVKVGPAPFMTPDWLERNRNNGYPYFEHDGKVYFGYTTADGLANLIESEKTPVAGPVGVTIEGREVIEGVLAKLEDVFGNGAKFTLKIKRVGGKQSFPINQTPTLQDLVGTSGRFELNVETTKTLPVSHIAFDYRFAEGKFYFRPDEIECVLPKFEGDEPKQVGSPVLIVWSIFSTIQTIHALLNPTVDCFVPDEIESSAVLQDGKLNVDCGPNPVSVRCHWSLWWGILRWEYSRPLTGLVLGVPQTMLQFHKSRIYREVLIEVK